MSTLLKDVYNRPFYNRLAAAIQKVHPDFDSGAFLRQVLPRHFTTMELKQRMHHTTLVLHKFLPASFPAAVKVLRRIIGQLRKDGAPEDGLAYLVFPDYIETYGLEQFQSSVDAIEFVTQFVSCEFAVRPFLLRYGQQMIDRMKDWSLHASYKVRRLASEGSRPRLPWAVAIPALKKDPSPILPILENLKNDPAEWVRRSVANSLNDIARDHPDLVLSIAKKWTGISPGTDAIIKHGSRTLLKKGHAGILGHYGLDSSHIGYSAFKILTPDIKVGESLSFTFSIVNKSAAPQKARLEYAVYYRRKNGEASKKVFKISEKIYQPGAKATILRKQKFVLITTRTFYTGEHKLAVIINGDEKKGAAFRLH